MDWRWRGLSARPSLQRTSKASTKGAVKEAAMVKLPLLCSELVLQAMKVIFSGRQGKSADGWTSSLAQKSVGTYNWLMQIPRLSQQHSPGCSTAHRQKNTFALQNSPNLTSLTTPPQPPPPPPIPSPVFRCCCVYFLHANAGSHSLPTAVELCFLLLSTLLISHLLTLLSGKRKTYRDLSAHCPDLRPQRSEFAGRHRPSLLSDEFLDSVVILCFIFTWQFFNGWNNKHVQRLEYQPGFPDKQQ